MKVVVNEFVTLDGVMQGPGRPDEDPRGGFEHGGWAVAYADPELQQAAAAGMADTAALLLGRRTYEDFYRVWPNAPEPNPFTEILNRVQKFVASRTLREPLPWQNSTLLRDDAIAAVARLREQPGKDLVVLGSGELVRELIRHDLVDRYVLLVHPLVLGSGRRLFGEPGPRRDLRLVDVRSTPSGVVILGYEPAVGDGAGSGPATATGSEAAATVAANKGLVRRFIEEVFERGRTEAVDELVAGSFVPHTWPSTGDGRADLKRAIERVGRGLADARFEIEDMIGEGDRVAVRLTASARQIGEFMGMPSRGGSYTIGEIHIFRVEDGRIVEHWHQFDALGMMRKLQDRPAAGDATRSGD